MTNTINITVTSSQPHIQHSDAANYVHEHCITVLLKAND